MENRIFLQRYRLSLGRNGLPVELHRSPTARTFRAQEIETGREVALMLAPEPDDPATIERREAEARAALEINQINIPRLYDFGRENGELIYVTEYCEGHSAAAWVAARGPLEIGPALRVALQAADAMSATAFRRLHHPALNPDNIVFVPGQTAEGDWPPVKVLHWYAPPPDFSGPSDARIESAARFAAPEQLQNGEVDVRSEIFSLGATIWFLLTGMPPASESAATRAGLGKLRGVPKIVRHLLDRMLRADPAERPQDLVALSAYLQTCLARVDRRTKIERRLGLPLLAKARVAVPKPHRPIPIKPLAWAVAGLAVVAFAIVFLPGPLFHKRSTPRITKASRLPETLPNEVPVMTPDSLARRNAQTPSTAPVTAAQTLPADEIPRDEMARTAPGSPPAPNEPDAPVEGPAESMTPPPTVVASNPAAEQPAKPEADTAEESSVASPVVAEASEPPAAASTPVEATPAAEEKPAAVASSTSPALESKPSRPKPARAKRAVAASSTRSPSHSPKTRRVARTAKRAQPLPELRVGSAPAELVGTTSDGRWILSVEESGRRVIVPPPPGYGQ